MKKVLLMATAFSALLSNTDVTFASDAKNEQGWLDWALQNVTQAYVCSKEGVCKVTNGVNTFLDVNVTGTKEYVSDEVKDMVNKSFAVCKRKFDVVSSKNYNEDVVRVAYDTEFENWYKKNVPDQDVNFFKGKIHATYLKMLHNMQEDLLVKKKIENLYSTPDYKLNDQVIAMTDIHTADCVREYDEVQNFLSTTSNLYTDFRKSNSNINKIKERLKDVLRFMIKVASDPDVQKIFNAGVEKLKGN